MRPRRRVRLLARAQVDFGGDEILRLKLSDGSERRLDAGQGLTLSAGLLYQSTFPLATFPLAIEATVGYKFALLTLSDGSADFWRIPFDVIVTSGGVGHRVGIGATAHVSPTVSCSISGVCNGEVSLDAAHGLILQYSYNTERSNRSLELGARVTLLSYSVDNETIGGNSIGVFVSGRL